MYGICLFFELVSLNTFISFMLAKRSVAIKSFFCNFHSYISTLTEFIQPEVAPGEG